MGNVRMCECGLAVHLRGMAAHRSGQDHRTRLRRKELKAQGFIELPGTTANHVAAFIERSQEGTLFRVVAFPYFARGHIRTPGYTSFLVGLQTHIVLKVAEGGFNATRSMERAAQRVMPLEGPDTLAETIITLEREASYVYGTKEHDTLMRTAAVCRDLLETRGETVTVDSPSELGA